MGVGAVSGYIMRVQLVGRICCRRGLLWVKWTSKARFNQTNSLHPHDVVYFQFNI